MTQGLRWGWIALIPEYNDLKANQKRKRSIGEELNEEEGSRKKKEMVVFCKATHCNNSKSFRVVGSLTV